MFHHVGVLIYVFDAGSKEFDKDVVYWRECIEACNRYSPEAKIFVLVHKMDLMGEMKEKKEKYRKFKRDLEHHSGGIRFRTFATSIWDESLYKVRFSSILVVSSDNQLPG